MNRLLEVNPLIRKEMKMNFARRQSTTVQDEQVTAEDAQRNSELFDASNKQHLSYVLEAVNSELDEDPRQMVRYGKVSNDPLMQIATIIRDKMPILRAIEMGKGIIGLEGFKAPTTDIEFAVYLARWSEAVLSPEKKSEKVNETNKTIPPAGWPNAKAPE